MINTPSDSIALSQSQTQQLAVYEGKLSNMKSAVVEARQELLAVREETERAVKERDYQKQMLEALVVESKSLSDEIEASRKTQKSLHKDIESRSEELKELNEAQDQRAQQLRIYGNELAQAQEKLSHEQDVLSVNSIQLSADQLSIQNAKDAFLKAVESVTWR